jgi:hypothetical protein
MLFFETDEIAAMHAAIRARGGQASAIEKVNWIKMRVFQVRDPDGHTLWFGQSHDAPDQRASQHGLRQIMPVLPCGDVPAVLPFIQYSPVNEVAHRIATALATRARVDLSALKPSTISKSLATLEDLGFIVRKPGAITVTSKMRDLAKSPDAPPRHSSGVQSFNSKRSRHFSKF